MAEMKGRHIVGHAGGATAIRVGLLDGRDIDLAVDRVEWARELARAREEGGVVAVRDRSGQVLSIDPSEIDFEFVGAPELEDAMSRLGFPAPMYDDDSATAPPTTRESLAFLRDQLGAAITAYLLGFDDVDSLSSLSDEAEPTLSGEARGRLRGAEEITRMIAERFDSGTARTWLFGENTVLDGQAPVDALRHASDEDRLAEVRAAAMRAIGL